MQLTGAKILMECLLEQGVNTIFGYPGGTILNVYDALYDYRDQIEHILTSHEQGASHAADGYSRATGKVGVCFATSGPGATNLVTGIATAHMDSVPMVAVTCNVANPLLGRDSFQEVDIVGITMPITKHGFIVRDISKLADTIRRAFQIAQSGRPGPVLVDITKDVTAEKTEYKRQSPKAIERATDAVQPTDVAAAVKAISKSQKPVILVGGGVAISGAENELREFVKKVDAPVADTLMGKGAFDGTDPYYIGMLGMHGTKAANLSVTKCDLLITLGARFSDRVTGNVGKFAKKSKILHIDVDSAEINKNIRVDHSITGDLKYVLGTLNKELGKLEHKKWLDEVLERKETYPLTYRDEGLTGPYVIQTIDKVTGGDAVITTDVGQHQMWAAQYFKFRQPRTFLTSGGMGTMGYGLGACIGAKTALPEKTVINIAGDGCFRMNMNELATATRYNIPIVQVVLNNHVLGMVRQWQTLFYEKRYSHTVLKDKVDFVKLAEAMGAKAYRITKRDEVEPVLREAIALGQPVLLDCIIDNDDKVWPMVAPGAAIADVFSEEDL